MDMVAQAEISAETGAQSQVGLYIVTLLSSKTKIKGEFETKFPNI